MLILNESFKLITQTFCAIMFADLNGCLFLFVTLTICCKGRHTYCRVVSYQGLTHIPTSLIGILLTYGAVPKASSLAVSSSWQFANPL
ncbi:hypothetical protein BDW67DRAFT_160761 [Aspergillus spinulosporus]